MYYDIEKAISQWGGLCRWMDNYTEMLCLGCCINSLFMTMHRHSILLISWNFFIIVLRISFLEITHTFMFLTFRYSNSFLEVCWFCLSLFRSKLDSIVCLDSICLHNLRFGFDTWTHSFRDANMLILIPNKRRRETLAYSYFHDSI